MTSPSSDKQFPCILHGHASTWHDGAAAILDHQGQLWSLAAERVGDRHKHHWNSRDAYDFLRGRLHLGCLPAEHDYFEATSQDSIQRAQHHLWHAALAFWGSPFSDAAVLVVDGQGPDQGGYLATSIWRGDGDDLTLLESLSPVAGPFVAESIGHFYTAIGLLAGMTGLHEEGKTMALAAYGRPSRFLPFLRQYVTASSDGRFSIDGRFVRAVFGNTLGPRLYGWPPLEPSIQSIWEEYLALRRYPLPSSPAHPTQDDMDVAYAGQLVLEELLIALAERVRAISRRLCFVGGVALNCVANTKLLHSGLFDDVFIPPAPDDTGQALGKLFVDVKKLKLPVSLRLTNAFLGPLYSDDELIDAHERSPDLKLLASDPQHTIRLAASLIAQGRVLGWFQGRSELGPRALGHRSILADPRASGMRAHINDKIKGREWYRPLAPAILVEHVADFFDFSHVSEFMQFAATAHPGVRALIPSAIHVDGTARIQTVSIGDDPIFYDLIRHFQTETGIPLVINTSFNGKGEPIVETPIDAVAAFQRLGLDGLVLGRFLLVRS